MPLPFSGSCCRCDGTIPEFRILFTIRYAGSPAHENHLPILCARKTRVGFTSEALDIPMNLLTMGLPCAIGLVVISEEFADLGPELEIRIHS